MVKVEPNCCATGVYASKARDYMSTVKTYWNLFRHATTLVSAGLSISEKYDGVSAGLFGLSVATDILECLVARYTQSAWKLGVLVN